MNEDAFERTAHRGHEGVDVARASLQHPEQVDAGGEDLPGAGENDGPSLVRVLERLHEGVAQLQVESVGLAVLDAQHGDTVMVFAMNHRRFRSCRWQAPGDSNALARGSRDDTRFARKPAFVTGRASGTREGRGRARRQPTFRLLRKFASDLPLAAQACSEPARRTGGAARSRGW